MNEIQKKLYQAACEAQKKAHAPYSKAMIGAAIMMANGDIFTGCNVENASYGGTICAERTAVLKSVCDGTSREIKEVMVVSDAAAPWPPCGFCRQTIAEFGTPETLIHTANLQGKFKTFTFGQIFPEAFTPVHLEN